MTAQLIYPGSIFFRGETDVIYDIIAKTGSGLRLDVGAAAGKVTRKLGTDPESRVISFEPFEGNIEHFLRNTAGMENVDLRRTAVSDFDGQGRLFVAGKLKGTEKGWEGYAGYSSSGTLISQQHPKWDHARTDEVSVCSIDSTVDEPVQFVKIDVQGGELGVLRGADKTIAQHGISAFYVEYEGDHEVLTFLAARGYVLIDSGQYVYSPKPGSPDPSQLSSDFKEATVSSGRKVYRGELSKRPLELDDYIKFIGAFGDWALQTDIVAIHESFMPQFLIATARVMND